MGASSVPVYILLPLKSANYANNATSIKAEKLIFLYNVSHMANTHTTYLSDVSLCWQSTRVERCSKILRTWLALRSPTDWRRWLRLQSAGCICPLHLSMAADQGRTHSRTRRTSGFCLPVVRLFHKRRKAQIQEGKHARQHW